MDAAKLPTDKQDRLSEISAQYSRLRAAFESSELSHEQKEIIWNHIQALKDERIAILGE